MRCPECRKLYSVESNLLADDVSKFECVNCQTTFFAMKPLLGGSHFLETRLLETQFAPIHHQALSTIDGFVDAPQATARFASEVLAIEERDAAVAREAEDSIRTAALAAPIQSNVAKDLEMAESIELVALWQAVVDDFQNISAHEAFIARAYADQRLAYASHKYAQILAAAPHEVVARRMRDRVLGLASYGFDSSARGLSLWTWNFPLPSFNSFIILLGTILVCVGFGFPHMRQTAGLGFAMIALALGLRFFLRRPRG